MDCIWRSQKRAKLPLIGEATGVDSRRPRSGTTAFDQRGRNPSLLRPVKR